MLVSVLRQCAESCFFSVVWSFSDFLMKKVQKIQIFGLQVSKIHILVVILLRIKLEKLLVLAYS